MSLLPQPITLDRHAEVPLGVQLAWALRAQIERGDLAAGERLPGARELAAAVRVNVNTVRSVYARLEGDGLLAVVHGRGTFVAAGSRAAGTAAVYDLAAVVEREALARGIAPREVAAALYVRDGSDRPGPDEVVLREQITSLDRELASLPALPPVPEGRHPTGARTRPTELEPKRDALADRLRERQSMSPTAPTPLNARTQPAPRGSTTRLYGAKLRWLPDGR